MADCMLHVACEPWFVGRDFGQSGDGDDFKKLLGIYGRIGQYACVNHHI